jgi:hypothetical protein
MTTGTIAAAWPSNGAASAELAGQLGHDVPVAQVADRLTRILENGSTVPRRRGRGSRGRLGFAPSWVTTQYAFAKPLSPDAVARVAKLLPRVDP